MHGMPITQTPITSYILFSTLRAKRIIFATIILRSIDLLDEARRETDDLRRVKLYREAEQLILNDAPGVMLLHHTYEGLFQPYVEGDRGQRPWRSIYPPVGRFT